MDAAYRLICRWRYVGRKTQSTVLLSSPASRLYAAQGIKCSPGDPQRYASFISWRCSTRSIRIATTATRRDGSSGDPLEELDGQLLLSTSVAGFAGAAVLGPLCDGQHSAHDVLHYAHPSILIQTPLLSLESCWWVPILFGVAGVILCVAHPVLDRTRYASAPTLGRAPSWPLVYIGNAAFVIHYASSGILESPLHEAHKLGGLLSPLDALLTAGALLLWAAFDRSRQGLAMAALTAVAGPAVEILLINQLHLYHYTHPDLFGGDSVCAESHATCNAGVPSWIPWVYFAGAPAVGNLGRRIYADLSPQSTPQ